MTIDQRERTVKEREQIYSWYKYIINNGEREKMHIHNRYKYTKKIQEIKLQRKRRDYKKSKYIIDTNTQCKIHEKRLKRRESMREGDKREKIYN